MLRRAHLTGLLALLAVLVTAASAQQAATLTLRSGETVSGDLIDLGGVGFTVRVDGEERRIRAADVSMIDFGGASVNAPDAARDLPSGQSLLLLTNGLTFQGEFYDISGTSPLRITFRTSSGERSYDSTDVRMVYMTRVTDDGGGQAAQPRGGNATGGRAVNVLARNPWTPTGLTVRQGQTVRFSTSGEVRITLDVAASAAGNSSNMYDRTAPVPNVLQGALIGRITNGRNVGNAFAIGNQTSVPMPATGQLFLGVNDANHGDNSGQFSVVITP